MERVAILRKLSYDNFQVILKSLENQLLLLKTSSEPSDYFDDINQVIQEIKVKIDRLEKVKN